MGWNSWNKFACNINETLIKETANSIIQLGLDTLGYKYINLDDCWSGEERVDGKLIPHPKFFPSGIKSLAKYMHDRGLKLGIYGSAGTHTCEQRFPGSLGYEEIDAKTFASWDVDYLKYDNCFNEGISPKIRYKNMADALSKSGRDIYYSVCQWGEENPHEWLSHYAGSWRTTGDIKDNYFIMMDIIRQNDKSAAYASKSQWNDADMLEVGNGKMSFVEYRTHMSLWALVKSPLLIGCDLTKLSEEAKSLLMNRGVISINQDDLGVQGRLIFSYPSNDPNKRSTLLVRKCAKGPDQIFRVDAQNNHILYENKCLSVAENGNLVFGNCQNKRSKWQVKTLQNGNSMIINLEGEKNQKCAKVWSVGNGETLYTWNGPNLILEDCNEKSLWQQFNITKEGYFKWDGIIEYHLNRRERDICWTIDTSYEYELWGGPLSSGRYAAALVNRGLEDAEITLDLLKLGIEGRVTITDVWSNRVFGIYQNTFKSIVKSHDTLLIILSKPNKKN